MSANLDTISKALRLAEQTVRNEMPQLMTQEGAAILVATYPFVPVADHEIRGPGGVSYPPGNLKSSGKVDPMTWNGDIAEIQVRYGGEAAPYAVFVHERLDLHHKPPTQAKFLEKPALEYWPKIPNKMKSHLQPKLEGLKV